MWRRIAPAWVLVLLAPFVGEFLLGNTTLSAAFAYPVDAAMYGAGAVLVREVTRRAGRGWPTMLALAAAYGLVEEGFGDMSLFNPRFAGLHLLAPGNLDGIGWTWWLFVLTLHVVWSMGASIALTEALYARRGTAPWLGRVGLTVTAAVFVVGVAVIHWTFRGGLPGFPAYELSAGQALLTAVGTVLCIVVAFLFPRVGRRHPAGTGRVPAPWLVTLLAAAAGAVFELANHGLPGGWPIPVDLVLYALAAVLLVGWSRGRGWTARHAFAPAAGALLVYCVVGFAAQPKHGIDLAGQVGFVVLTLALTALAVRKTAVGRVPAPAAPMTPAAG
ncbi:hypothetical protein Athai_65850 [Actinocatenispora thailandica]|uniref:DUF998 domain-containing protein n=1 Tax=Actinocatenispora thailandica TaxID=227318 RepID=A0A7R7I069_9ACTN|nr:hypothetical protein [Actinocatenispora thailandica]BCJ39082.1 hypothetical protein Athai_65850 [Actinocatenispora thailandica]